MNKPLVKNMDHMISVNLHNFQNKRRGHVHTVEKARKKTVRCKSLVQIILEITTTIVLAILQEIHVA